MLISEKARSIVPYTAGEQAEGFIKLNTNENPYPPSPAAAAAIRNFDTDALRLYPSPDSAKLRAAIAAAEGVAPDSVFVGNGSDEVLALAFAALFDPDKPIEFADVTYSFYPVFARLFDIPYRTVPLDDDFTLPLDRFALDNGAVLANPNAPTGLGVPTEAIRAAAARSRRALIVDEAYIDFADTTASAVPLTAEFANLAVVKTFSKSYGLAGIRCGYMIADPGIIRAMRAVKDSFNSYPVDRVCEAAAAAAIADRRYLAEMTARVKATRARVIAELKARGTFVTDAQTNFLFMEGGRELYEKFRAENILVRHFDKPRIAGFLRVSIGTDADMDQFLRVYDKIR